MFGWARIIARSSSAICEGPSSPMETPAWEPQSRTSARLIAAIRTKSYARVRNAANVAANGTSQVTFNAVVVGGQAASAYRNYAEITSSPNFDPDSTPGNNSTTEDDNANAGPVISDLSLGKTLALAAGGGQNTNGTNFVPNDGPEAITSDPSRKSVPGNFFYLNPRNFTLSARMDF